MKQLELGFEYTYLHDDWTTPLSELLAGISVREAQWRIGPDSKSIWEIVLHLAKWNENIVDRVEHRDTSDPSEDRHWPAIAAVADQSAWKLAQVRLSASLDSVANMLSVVSLEKVQASEYGLADLLCRFTHVGYHFGQITKIRECFAASE